MTEPKITWRDFVPSKVDKIVGNLEKIFFEPCSTPPTLWVTTGFPALLRAFITIIEPDPKEAYHELLGHSLYHDIKQSIREAHEEGSLVTDGFRNLVFGLADIVDMSVWYLFLASVGEDFLANWTSQVMRLANCTESKKGTILGGWVGSSCGWDTWADTECVVSDGAGGTQVATTNGWSYKHHSCTCAVWAAPCLPWTDIGISAQTRIVDSYTGEVVAQGSNHQDKNGDWGPSILHFHQERDAYRGRHLSWQSYASNPGGTSLPYYTHSRMGGYVSVL